MLQIAVHKEDLCFEKLYRTRKVKYVEFPLFSYILCFTISGTYIGFFAGYESAEKRLGFYFIYISGR